MFFFQVDVFHENEMENLCDINSGKTDCIAGSAEMSTDNSNINYNTFEMELKNSIYFIIS